MKTTFVLIAISLYCYANANKDPTSGPKIKFLANKLHDELQKELPESTIIAPSHYANHHTNQNPSSSSNQIIAASKLPNELNKELSVNTITTGTTDVTAESLYSSNPTWMKDFIKEIGDIPLSQLSIPGSHDSGTYNFDSSSKIFSMAKAQNVSLTQQLNAGIRFLDIRYGNKEVNGENVIGVFHTLYANLTFTDALKELKDWMQNHPGEFITVTTQWSGMGSNTVSNDQKTDIINLWKSMFGDYLINSSDTWFDIKTATLNKVLNKNKELEKEKRMYLFCHEEFYYDLLSTNGDNDDERKAYGEGFGMWKKDEHVIDSYPDKNQVEDMKDYLVRNMLELGSNPSDDKWNINQVILTPKLMDPLKEENDKLLEHKDNLKLIQSFMGKKRINYVLYDFVDLQPALTRYQIQSNMPYELTIHSAILDNNVYQNYLTQLFMTKKNVLMLTEPFNDLILYPDTLDDNLNEKKDIDTKNKAEMMNTTKYLYIVYQFMDNRKNDLVYAECTGLTWHSPKIFGYDPSLNGQSMTNLIALNVNNEVLVVKVWVGNTDIGEAAIKYLNPEDGSRVNKAEEKGNIVAIGIKMSFSGFPIITKKMNYDLKNQSFGSNSDYSNDTQTTAGNLVIAFLNKKSNESFILTVNDKDQVIKDPSNTDDLSTVLEYLELGSPVASSNFKKMKKKQMGQLD